MRLLQISSYGPPHLGGLEACAEMLFRSLLERDIDMRWVYCLRPTDEAGGRISEIEANDPVEHRFGIPQPIPTWRGLKQLFRAIKEADAVLIHDALYISSLFAALFAWFFGKPIVLLVHVWRVPYSNRFINALQAVARVFPGRMLLALADRVVTYNRNIVEWISPQVGHKLSFIPNGIHAGMVENSMPDDEADVALEMSRHGWSSETMLAIFAGRFVEKKGLHFVKKAAKELPYVQFLICGGWGPIDPASWGLPNVHVLGQLEKSRLRAWFRRANLLLLPSRGEGFPLVIQEAMFCGLTPAVFNETWEAWGDGKEHFILLEQEQIAAQIADFLENTPTVDGRDDISNYAKRHWDWEVTAIRYQSLIQSCHA